MSNGNVVLEPIIIRNEVATTAWQRKPLLRSRNSEELAGYCNPKVIAAFLQHLRYETSQERTEVQSSRARRMQLYEQAGEALAHLRRHPCIACADSLEATTSLKQDAPLYQKVILLLTDCQKNYGQKYGVADRARQLLNMLERI
ncbi:MAG: hypothetical protein QW568_04255 [Candidatus Anstonellaceae archaeon]